MKIVKRLLSSSLILFVKCNGGPDVTTYISNHPDQGFDYSNASGTKSGFVSYSSPLSDKLVCYTPDDVKVIIDYWKAACKPAQTTIKAQ